MKPSHTGAMQVNEKWPPNANPSAKLRAARAMPPWLQARGSAIPPPPPPPVSDLPSNEPEYEVIEFGLQTYSNQPAIKSNKEKKRCDLCGSSVPSVKCMQCVQQNFCYSCDEMYHRHPKRQSHIRKELDGGGPIERPRLPPLPPKGEPPPPPVPPPRRNKRAPVRPPPPHHAPVPLLAQPTSPRPSAQRDTSVSPKPGFVGSLKRIIGGVRPPPLPFQSHTLDRQTSLPPTSSMMNFHDQHMMNGYPSEWADMHRGHRSGSFSALNQPHFGPMMQAQSMAGLNCPSCHGHPGMWSPWTGVGPQWPSQAVLSRGGGEHPAMEEWSDGSAESDEECWRRERLRRFSTTSARVPRSYPSDESASVRDGGRRRHDWDNLSSRGGTRRPDPETLSNRGGSRRKEFDTMSTRGSSRKDFDTMSLRGGRRSDLESPSLRSHRRTSEKPRKNRYRELSDSTDERESDEEPVFPTSRANRKIMSDIEDAQKNRRRSEVDTTSRKKNRRNERFLDTGRRRSSPVQYKYQSPSEEEATQPSKVLEVNEKPLNGVEYIDGDAEDEEEIASIPDAEWECPHCTYVNEGGTRVCAICCKTCTKPKSQKSQNRKSQNKSGTPSKSTATNKASSPLTKLEDGVKKLHLEQKQQKEEPIKNTEKAEKIKERRGSETPEQSQRVLTSTGTSPPPQSISTQTYEEGGRKLKRATSLAEYSDWKTPQRSASRQSLLSDTQSTKRAGSQPPEYLSTLVQNQVKQGLEMVKLLREAEEKQFSAEDLAVALLHCGDTDPIAWLDENWRQMIDTVVTLGTNYGQERKENTVGTISVLEARDALRVTEGNVWAAVTHCVEQRQRKYAELLSRGNFSREDIVTALTAHHGDLEEAYRELNKNQLKPFLMRIWGPPQGADNDDGDITKLAHGEVVGRGGKNSEEVSVDLSLDSNYERIQSWLEEYVHTNYNFSKPQSPSSQSTTSGLKRSTSDRKIHNSSTSSRSNSTVFKDRRNSDIHRYLTALYNANDKTLLVNKHSKSTLSLFNVNRNKININKDIKTEKNVTGKSFFEDKNIGKQSGDVETITIKLNPTIVKSDKNVKKYLQNEYPESSTEELNSDSSDNEESRDISKTLKLEQLRENSQEVKTPQSGFESDIPEANEELSRSASQTSNESFESVHSSVDEQDYNKNAPKSKNDATNLKLTKGKQTNNEKLAIQLGNTRYNDYADIKLKTKQNNQEIPSKSPTKPEFDNVKKIITENDDSEFENGEMNIQEGTVPVNYIYSQTDEGFLPSRSQDFSSSTNDSGENFEEVESDEDIPYIEDTFDNPQTSEMEIKTAPAALFQDGSDSSNYDTRETESEKNGLSETKRYMSQLAIPTKRNHLKENTKEYAESDFDEDFSDESVSNQEEKGKFPPVKTLKRVTSQKISEANSDRDVSYIPTDSEKEPLQKEIKRDTNIASDQFQARQLEILDLLKKSLTKDDVVEKLVTTLLASVLNVTADKRNAKEPIEAILTQTDKEVQPKAQEETEKIITIDEKLNDDSKSITKQEQISLHHRETENESLRILKALELDNNRNIEKTNELEPNDVIPESNDGIELKIEYNGSAMMMSPQEIEVETSTQGLFEKEHLKINNINAENVFNERVNLETSDNNNSSQQAQDINISGTENITVSNLSNISNESRVVSCHDQIVAMSSEPTTAELSVVEDRNDTCCAKNTQEGKSPSEQMGLSTRVEANISSQSIVHSAPNSIVQVAKHYPKTSDLNSESEKDEGHQSKDEEAFHPHGEYLQREARRLLAEGLVMTYEQAEIAARLKALEFTDEEQVLAAANECDSLDAAVAYLQQECQVCAGKYSAKQMVSMLECEHSCCTDCASNYFTLQITERSINDCVCPFCREPDILHLEEDKAQSYFSNLDIFLKQVVKETVHELFQRKLRDRTLMNDPNFKWCPKCSSGFIADPRQKRMTCPDCKAVTCAKCLKPWEKEHESRSCDEFSVWAKENDPENLLVKHLDENGVTCPKCKAKYLLAKGGCMHLNCPGCSHEFCSGCSKPFLLGSKCSVSVYCEKLGLHSHHPRNCLFYLRDKEPEELEHLLEENNIAFNKSVDTNSSLRCGVQMLRETPDGFVEGICGYATLKAGFCRTHYIENLVMRIRLSKIDPVKLLDFNEAVQELKRHGKPLPNRPSYMSEFNYRQVLYQVIEREIPLD